MKKILLHHCCVVCTPEVLKFFWKNFDEVTGLWFNPNIYPEHEFQKRLTALKIFSSQENHNLIIKTDYSNEKWLEEVTKIGIEEPKRCEFCYYLRLKTTATSAKIFSIEDFSTTLLASPYQKHELVKQIGEKVAKETGVNFIYNDFRPLFYNGKNEIRKRGLYTQKYCGCKFSVR
ncbi:MAG: epoxyqueuosine reductase QueH [Endomicrobiia bacterium]